MKRFRWIVVLCCLFLPIGCSSNAELEMPVKEEDMFCSESDYLEIEDFYALEDKLIAVLEGPVFSIRTTFYFYENCAVNSVIETSYAEDMGVAAESFYQIVLHDPLYQNVQKEGLIIRYSHTKEGFASYSGLVKEQIRKSLENGKYTIIP